MSIALYPPQNAGFFLQEPFASGTADRIWGLRESAGPIVGGVDWALSMLLNFSPLEEWVAKPLGGDWSALDRGAVAWTNAGKAVAAIAENLEYLPGATSDAWQGETATAFGRAQHKVSSALKPIPGACDSMSEMCTALADMAQAIAEFSISILVAVAEFAVEFIAALSSVVGSVTTPAWVTKLALKLKVWVPKLARMIDLFLEMLPKVAGIIKHYKESFSKLKTIIEVLMQLGRDMANTQAQLTEATNAVNAATAGSGGGDPSSGRRGGGGSF
jgi:uncharacterized protein YukE